MQLDLVIFDMDGVLIDSERVAKACYFEVAKTRGIAFTEKHFNEILGTTTASEIERMAEYFPEADWEAFLDDVQAKQDAYFETYGVPVKPGAEALLQFLQEHAVPAYVASSTARDKLTYRLKKAGLYQYFTGQVCGDDVTHSKPNPEIFLKAFAQVPEAQKQNTLILEDSYQGLEAALRAEIPVIMVPDLLPPPTHLKNYRVMRDLNEVLAFFRQAI